MVQHFATEQSTQIDQPIPRILVVTGWEKKTELWSRPESQCPLPNFPRKVSWAVGFWTTQGPTVCGGFAEWEEYNNKCFLYRKHMWMPWTNMRVARSSASA